MTGPINFDAINREALASFPAVLARILPGGKRIGSQVVALNPTRADRRLGSFRIAIVRIATVGIVTDEGLAARERLGRQLRKNPLERIIL